MAVDLSIKRVPDEVANRLRQLAVSNHRSLQGELMAMLDDYLARKGKLTPRQVMELARADGLSGPSEALQMIREDRDR